MTRRSRRRGFDPLVDGVRLALAAILLLALVTGDIRDFPRRALAIVVYMAIAAIVVGILALVVAVAWKFFRNRRLTDERWIGTSAPAQASLPKLEPQPVMKQLPERQWTTDSIREALVEIDWYQFEKFCSVLLATEGHRVVRKGGANPDGGVDLEVAKDGVVTLVQCKHWLKWKVKEPVVRELLGSMTDFGIPNGAIYTLNGWTEPAARLARRHGIQLADGSDLAFRAKQSLDTATLDRVLNASVHHCPKCEGPMVLRTGAFAPFWGCARFPVCRGKLNHTGKR